MTEGFSKKPALSRKRKAIDNPSSFKMHAGSKLQFEILKELNHVPRHGYEIFQILQEKRLLSDRSDVYKIIRAMKAKDIITSTSVPSKRGYPKEILQLTEHGKDLYLQHVIGSLRENEILMSERLASNCGITMIQLVSSFIEMDGSRLQVMVDNDHGSHDRVLPLMKRLFEPVRKQVNILVRGLETASEWVIAEAAREQVSILQQNDVLQPKSIDIIASIGIQQKNQFHAKFQGTTSWMDLLKPGGLLVAIFFKAENRPCCGRYDIVADEFSGPQKSRFLQEFRLDPGTPRYRPPMTISNEEITDFLMDRFVKVKTISILDFFDVFIAQKATTTIK
jgi:DNA-binding PadR family transcriptional regulator